MAMRLSGAMRCAISLTCAMACSTQAQSYPAKAVRYIVPNSAGSGADTLGRIVAGGLTQLLGQQFIVDNRAGAAGNIGADAVAKAQPDGYTLLQVSMSNAANVSLYRNLPFDLTRDFAAVTQLASSPSALVVHPSLPVKSVADFVRLAKARPGAINYASTGAGSATFVAAELFKGMAAADLQHVPYRGGGEALTAVMSGEVSVYFAPFAVALPHIKQGRVRTLAVTSAKRLPLMPDYPTIAESGYAGYLSGNWYGLMLPVKAPKEIIAAVRSAAIATLSDAAIGKRMSDLGYISVGDQPDEFMAFIKSEIATLGKIMQQTGVTAN
jgi:tripartite-type tricarboxylate transporter receptor subunit TctC